VSFILLGGQTIQVELAEATDIPEPLKKFQAALGEFQAAKNIFQKTIEGLNEFLEKTKSLVESNVFTYAEKTNIPLLGDRLGDSKNQALRFLSDINSEIKITSQAEGFVDDLLKPLLDNSRDAIKNVFFNIPINNLGTIQLPGLSNDALQAFGKSLISLDTSSENFSKLLKQELANLLVNHLNSGLVHELKPSKSPLGQHPRNNF
jgi:hypothetical protein